MKQQQRDQMNVRDMFFMSAVTGLAMGRDPALTEDDARQLAQAAQMIADAAMTLRKERKS